MWKFEAAEVFAGWLKGIMGSFIGRVERRGQNDIINGWDGEFSRDRSFNNYYQCQRIFIADEMVPIEFTRTLCKGYTMECRGHTPGQQRGIQIFYQFLYSRFLEDGSFNYN